MISEQINSIQDISKNAWAEFMEYNICKSCAYISVALNVKTMI